MSPENEPQPPLDSQEPDQPEEVQPTAEIEASLERLKNPEYWQRRFQTEWEQKAGQEKNWSGLREMREFIPDDMDGVFAVTSDGKMICFQDFGYTEFHKPRVVVDKIYYSIDLFNNQDRLKTAWFSSHPNLVEKMQRKIWHPRGKLPDKTSIQIYISGCIAEVFDLDGKRKQKIKGFTDYSLTPQVKYPMLRMSVGCTDDGRVVQATTENRAQIWSSPFYAGYWLELNRDQEMTTASIGQTLNQALDDITNMPLERIWDLQIDSAIKTFSQRLPSKKQNRAEWQDCADVINAFRQGFKAWCKSKEVPDTAISRATPPSEAPQATDRSISQAEKPNQ